MIFEVRQELFSKFKIFFSDDMTTLADRLSLAMDDCPSGKMSNMDLYRASGIGEATIRSYRTGKAKAPNPDYLSTLAKTLGVNFQWLATGEGPMRGPIQEAQHALQEFKESVGPAIEAPKRKGFKIERFRGGTVSAMTDPDMSEARYLAMSVLFDDLRGLGEEAPSMSDEDLTSIAATIRRIRSSRK